ncbi:HK97-gp10 family putative phage morphogenesis protein [Maritimibacter alexandrii]|uniref:HK97-gp10 family putative phage morphogenesis protein n=1 Tax=Maritimibacter alexandrii TaxID=2570355 RepID=UPI001107E35D|nr:HK97-gp10 family putative phage morphogenesis protein [Maritimibacter alexandrii]
MDLKFEGGRELERLLMDLPSTVAKASGRRVLKKAAAPIKAAAEQLAADDPATAANDLHRSIGISSRAAARGGKAGSNEVQQNVGVLTSIHDGRGPERQPYAAAMVNEFGSHKMAAHPFMRPAFETRAPEAWDIIVAQLRIDVAKTVARHQRRMARAGG